MKKLKMAISLLLAVIICSFALVSCGSNSGSDGDDKGPAGNDEGLNTDDIVGEQVTQSEWINALLLSGVTGFTFKSYEIVTISNISTVKTIYNINGTYNDRHVNGTRKSTIVGLNTQSENFNSDISSAPQLFSDYVSTYILGTLYSSDIVGKEDCGFSQFTYNAETGSYDYTQLISNSNDEGENSASETISTKISIKFNNGHIACITVNVLDEIIANGDDFSYGSMEFSSNTLSMEGTYILTDFT